MRSVIITALVLLLTFSCRFSRHREFVKIFPDVYFKLHRFGEDNKKPETGDFITVSFSYTTLHDSLIYKASKKLRIEDTKNPGSVHNCLKMLNKGDSASFIFKTDDFFVKNLHVPVPSDLINHKYIRMNVLLTDIQTSEEFVNEKKLLLQWSYALQDMEKDIINNFIEGERISVSPTPDGLYFVLLKVGSGKRPHKGDLVKVNYEGRFFDGRFFDSTLKRSEPLDFIYGQEYIVIKGLEEAIGMMREGDKALIIVPSDLAFGSSGAGEGIIPPYTALIYEVELISVLPATGQSVY